MKRYNATNTTHYRQWQQFDPFLIHEYNETSGFAIGFEPMTNQSAAFCREYEQDREVSILLFMV